MNNDFLPLGKHSKSKSNDKKNNDNKINFILLKNIGKTVLPNKSKISIKNLKNISKTISQY